MRALILPFFLAAMLVAPSAAIAARSSATEVVRIKDLGKLKGWRENSLIGYGIVAGLAGTGDSPSNKTTRQAMANVYSQFDLTVAPEQVQSRNVAVVMVSAMLPPFARPGDAVDVVVTSAGDARSLVGGNLLATALKAPNGKIYALAQGPLSVGGYRYDMNGNVVQKNHPTAGSIPGGALVEVGVNAQVVTEDGAMTFVLSNPDYTTAGRVANEINRALGRPLAKARDAAGVDIQVPEFERDNLVAFVSRIEALSITPDQRAKVILDERTGTVVSGGNVRLSKVAISHGDLRISIVTDNQVSQPIFVRQGGDGGIRTEVVSNSSIDVRDGEGSAFVMSEGSTVAELVQALTKIRTSTRDIISILRAIKTAGALHADLIIQ
ncbi:flagellar basal body P-ring protein FlgI [Achromobacter sp. Marseille-Q0513]|uniref:flagellar basal body P-ring protein FlgI n=1 Tax=Achromobacter sp. Marseille-Q0513 TaxID=2829161 RepID=UPI001B95FAD8|nr:flagellar basal body P-ring protein FlgI [Achromobacter sp. Marseille-Q0513]MBR8651707.1 flagellar basal body P-ring protein FlgI [Achromobacter sp. Marseille-Q0513]